ncbi:MAG: LolA-related protein [Betaproteobacteria bacterium]
MRTDRPAHAAGSAAARSRPRWPAALCLAVCVMFFGPLAATAAEPWTVARLMQLLAGRGPERAAFTETKFIAMLDKPVVASGELRYAPPGRLEKRTVKPRAELLVLDRGMLSVERGGQTQTLRLADYPEIAAVVESIRGTLAGDRSALERVYRLDLHGTPERWTLVMLPSDQKLAALVQRIDVSGNGDYVRAIEILQADGDRSVMSIERFGKAAQ